MSTKIYKPKQIKQAIDRLMNALVGNLKKELAHCLESITLTGSYTVDDIAPQRPNVNIIIFFKPNATADDYIKLGDVFYSTAKKHLDYFRIRIDMLPFRFAPPIGSKELEFTITPLILNTAQKDQKPPFGVPSNVLEGMRAMRKVVFGSDILDTVDLTYSKADVMQWAFFDIGVMYRNQLIRAPLTYDINENLDLLASEAFEIGKVALYWGTEVFLNKEDLKKGKHLELIKDKKKMIEFYKNLDKELGKAAQIIWEARKSFQEYKANKAKALDLYRAAYTANTKVFLKTMSE